MVAETAVENGVAAELGTEVANESGIEAGKSVVIEVVNSSDVEVESKVARNHGPTVAAARRAVPAQQMRHWKKKRKKLQLSAIHQTDEAPQLEAVD